MTKILGHRVLVKVDQVEEKSKGGIVLVTDADKSRHQMAVCTGKVVGIGKTAYKEYGDGKPWVKVGDTVYFQKYGGVDITEGEDVFRILNDEDVLAIKD